MTSHIRARLQGTGCIVKGLLALLWIGFVVIAVEWAWWFISEMLTY